MSNITVTTTLNGISTSVPFTTYNPYTGLPATINTYQWYYYLVNGSSSTQTVTVQTGQTQIPAIYFCLTGPGGLAGTNEEYVMNNVGGMGG